MKSFLFATVFVILSSQSIARPMDTNPDGGIQLKFPRILQDGYTITLTGMLNNQSDRITVLLPAADNDDCKILYNYKDQTIEVTPGVDQLSNAIYDIKDKGGPFKLELTVTFNNKSGSPELNVTFNVNGADVPTPLYLDVSKCLESMDSIIFKEGVKTINTLSFNFVKRST